MRTPHWTSRDAPIVAPARRDDVIVESLDDELVLNDSIDGNTYYLNRTANNVWKRCDGRATTRQIAETISVEYDVDFDSALDDVEQLVVFFAQAGLTGASLTP